jgi:hypothetical protein
MLSAQMDTVQKKEQKRKQLFKVNSANFEKRKKLIEISNLFLADKVGEKKI